MRVDYARVAAHRFFRKATDLERLIDNIADANASLESASLGCETAHRSLKGYADNAEKVMGEFCLGIFMETHMFLTFFPGGCRLEGARDDNGDRRENHEREGEIILD